jgi:hypothetical protein
LFEISLISILPCSVNYTSREITFPGFGQNCWFETTHVDIWHVTFAFVYISCLTLSLFRLNHVVRVTGCSCFCTHTLASVREANYGLTDRCQQDFYLWPTGTVCIIEFFFCFLRIFVIVNLVTLPVCDSCVSMSLQMFINSNRTISMQW